MIDNTINSNYINAIQGKAKNDLIESIIEKASIYLKGSQLMNLNKTLNECLEGYEVFIDNNLGRDENYNETSKIILENFISTKKIEGASERTLSYYHSTIIKMLNWADAPLADITTEMIREYLNYAQSLNDCSNATLDNIRRVLSTFFNFCLDEGYIQINPMRRIKKIKSTKVVKKAYTDWELEALREHLSELPTHTEYFKLLKLRDRALFELLLSSGIRIQECVNLNCNDLDFNNLSFKVLGKGNKERICYFSQTAKYHLTKLIEYQPKNKNYLLENNGPLFISYKSGERLGINGVERRFRELGKEIGIAAHPHKFRRTFATNLIKKEVPIEQVKEMMGHSNMDTTMIYTVLDQDQIKMNHNRYSG